MSFLRNLLGASRYGVSVALFDIGADSVGGAYVHTKKNEIPYVLYAKRVPIISRSQEDAEQAMSRSLEVLGEALIREGAPILVRLLGKGSVEEAFVSLEAPWQTTTLRTEHIDKKGPFLFTKEDIAQVLKKTAHSENVRVLDETVVATSLNGYPTQNPYRKEARHASISVLTSTMSQSLLDRLNGTLGKLFHTKNTAYIAGTTLRHHVLRSLFPHEKDFIVLDTSEKEASALVVRGGFLSAIADSAHRGGGGMHAALKELATQSPLPQTIFLIMRDADAAASKARFALPETHALWLSKKMPLVIPIVPSHMASRIASETVTDIPLLLAGAYYREHARRMP